VTRGILGVLAGLLVCLAWTTTYAGYDQVFGELKKVDADAKTITVAARASRNAEPKEVTYKVADDATVKIGRETKTLADLEAGKRVIIVFKEADAGGTPTALLIRVMDRRRGGNRGGGNRGNRGGGDNNN